MKREIPPVLPGEMLLEEFLKPMGVSQYRLAKEIGVPPQHLSPHRCFVGCADEGSASVANDRASAHPRVALIDALRGLRLMRVMLI